MSQPGSEAAHDLKVVALLGEHADAVLSAPAAYPPLRADLIGVALAAGKTCRVKATSARLLIYAVDGEVRAVATELRHGGYRRAYTAHVAPTAEELVAALTEAYSA